MSDPLFKKPGSSRWWCRVPNPRGGRHLRKSTGHTDKRAALAEWRRLCRESVTRSDQAANPIALGDALDARIEERRSAGRAEGTISSLTQKARQLTRVLGAETPLSDVDAAAVDHYIATRLKESSRSTVAKELSALRGAMKLARRHRKDCPPVDEVMPLDFAVKYKPRTRALSEREIDALLGDLPPARAAIVAFVVATGATYPSEVANAMRADVDTKRWLVLLRGTKRETRHRRIPVPVFARRWLAFALRHARKEGRLFAPWPNVRRALRAAAARLSLCAECRERLRHRGPGKTAREACKACDRAPRFLPCSPNDLRRTLATQLRARGVEPSLIAPMLGHTDSRMVERVYGRVSPEALGHLLEQQIRGPAGGQPKPKNLHSKRKTG